MQPVCFPYFLNPKKVILFLCQIRSRNEVCQSKSRAWDPLSSSLIVSSKFQPKLSRQQNLARPCMQYNTKTPRHFLRLLVNLRVTKAMHCGPPSLDLHRSATIAEGGEASSDSNYVFDFLHRSGPRSSK